MGWDRRRDRRPHPKFFFLTHSKCHLGNRSGKDNQNGDFQEVVREFTPLSPTRHSGQERGSQGTEPPPSEYHPPMVRSTEGRWVSFPLATGWNLRNPCSAQRRYTSEFVFLESSTFGDVSDNTSSHSVVSFSYSVCLL